MPTSTLTPSASSSSAPRARISKGRVPGAKLHEEVDIAVTTLPTTRHGYWDIAREQNFDLDFSGGPGGDRTRDRGIMSPLL